MFYFCEIDIKQREEYRSLKQRAILES